MPAGGDPRRQYFTGGGALPLLWREGWGEGIRSMVRPQPLTRIADALAQGRLGKARTTPVLAPAAPELDTHSGLAGLRRAVLRQRGESLPGRSDETEIPAVPKWRPEDVPKPPGTSHPDLLHRILGGLRRNDLMPAAGGDPR